jgi:hypothetical protein
VHVKRCGRHTVVQSSETIFFMSSNPLNHVLSASDVVGFVEVKESQACCNGAQ